MVFQRLVNSSGHGGGLLSCLIMQNMCTNSSIVFLQTIAPLGVVDFCCILEIFLLITLLLSRILCFINNRASLGGGGLDIGFYEIRFQKLHRTIQFIGKCHFSS